MADPYVTKNGLEIHKPKLFLLTGKTSTGKDTKKWQIVGQVKNAAGEWVKKPSFVDAATAEEYGGIKKATKKEMATPKARTSCKAKAKAYEEKCEAKKDSKKKSPAKKKASPKKAKKAPVEEVSDDEIDEDKLEDSNSSEVLEGEESSESSESSEPAPVKKSPAKKAKTSAKAPAKKAKAPAKKAKTPAKKPAKKTAKK